MAIVDLIVCVLPSPKLSLRLQSPQAPTLFCMRPPPTHTHFPHVPRPGNQDTTAAVWDMRQLSTPIARLVGNMGAIRSLRFSPNGRFLAMAEPADFVHVFDVQAGFKQVGALFILQGHASGGERQGVPLCYQIVLVPVGLLLYWLCTSTLMSWVQEVCLPAFTLNPCHKPCLMCTGAGG